MFIDHATITVRAGRGGDGCVSFRREKYIPKGGPDGGSGGRGGSVIIEASRQMTTLMDFRYRRTYAASAGEHGKGANKTGKNGEDILLRVPCGTVVMDANSGSTLVDLVNDADRVVLVKGGIGGRGNAEFATSTNQAPRRAERGKQGEERVVKLELKLLADVGLVGFPNAGKSTIISVISAAKPKISDYPFTTLIPNLGIVHYSEYKSFVVADMPGLIEGAHVGKGLGILFLRHIERTHVLVLVIEATAPDLKEQHATLMEELKSFSKELVKRPRVVALTKMDLADQTLRRKVGKISFGRSVPVIPISAISGEGIRELVNLMWKKLHVNESRN